MQQGLINFSVDHKDDYFLNAFSNSDLSTFIHLDQVFNFFQLLPRTFTISTNNGSYKFNVKMLQDTCLVISNLLTNDPEILQYHIDINDEENTMAKIEKLYNGEIVEFNNSEVFFTQKIASILNIRKFPNFIEPYRIQRLHLYERDRKNIFGSHQVEIQRSSFILFLKNYFQRPFTFIVKKKKYDCNIIAVHASNKIKELIEETPDLHRYIYNIDDEFDEFQVICKLFNFESIQITNNNMNLLKQVAEDLQIDCILSKINDFIVFYENAVQTIDDKQLIIDTVDQIFDLLYNRNKLTVGDVKEKIVNSIWSQTEENAQELAACILQVIRTDFIYHHFIFDLLILLDEESNEFEYLKLIFPKVVNVLLNMNSLPECAFLYKLYQKGMVLKDKIKEKAESFLKHLNDILTSSYYSYKRDSHFESFMCAVLWFLPEFSECKNFSEKMLPPNMNQFSLRFFNFYYPNNMESYKKMRDIGEPEDSITKAIIHDDLDTLRKIFSLSNELLDFEKNKIPFNLFDSFVKNGQTSYINYSAAYGSLSCFKYFLLNHAKIDLFTLQYAVFGGNYEIIRIVDQYYNEQNIIIDYAVIDKFSSSYIYDENLNKKARNPIIPAIMKHQNDLFDWILQEKYINKNSTGDLLSGLIKVASENGNVHTLITCIDNGLNLNSIVDVEENMFTNALQLGFYRYQQLLYSFMNIKDNVANPNFLYPIVFGNLSIFKLFLKYHTKINNFDDALIQAVSYDHFNIVSYIVNDIFKDDLKLSKNGVIVSLNTSIQSKSKIFPFLLNKFNLDRIIDKYHLISNDFIDIMCSACKANNVENAKMIADLIAVKYPHFNFTQPFEEAIKQESVEICQYFIDKKVKIDLFSLAKKSSDLTAIDVRIFCLLLERADDEMKEMLLGSFLYKSLKSHNTKLVEYILKQNIPYENALFEAVQSHDVEIVKIVLKHNNSPSFINQISVLGTALNIAVNLDDFNIVQHLLSVPGIDPNLYQEFNQTPLISAITNFNMKIINLLLDFYGDEIQRQMWQLNVALEGILQKISTDDQFSKENLVFRQNIVPLYFDDIGFNFNSKNKKEIDHQVVLSVIKRLLEIKNIDLNCHSNKYTLLTYACQVNDIDLVKMLLESNNVNVNSYAPKNGNTPLMIAIENKNFDIAQLLIEYQQTNINLRNYNKETALTIAVDHQFNNIVSLLLHSEKFNPFESRLDYAFFISSGEIVNLLLEVKELDVNYRLIFDQQLKPDKEDALNRSLLNLNSGLFETSLIHAIIEKNIDKTRLIVNHSSFDAAKSQVKTAIFTTVRTKQIDIFRDLLPFVGNDVNIHFQNGNSLLTYAVKNKSEDIVTEIVNHDNFDSSKSDILKAFVNTFVYKNKNKMNQNIGQHELALDASMTLLYNYDNQHEHLIDLSKMLPNGKTFFTSINFDFENIGNIVSFLLNNGADPDLPDEMGTYPLELAILLNSYSFVRLLLDTERIDFNRKFYEQDKKTNGLTYLHLAAKQKDSRIFVDLVNLDVIDVNSADELGRTPLLIACEHVNPIIIQKLFLLNNLDYTHCNKNGEDAIKVASSVKKRKCRRYRDAQTSIVLVGKNETKGDYFSQLMAIINTINI